VHISVSPQVSEQIFTILRNVLAGEQRFALSTETGHWAHGLRFTLHDVRSATSGANIAVFDEITWDIEDALKSAGYPVTAVMKGKRLCMFDVDCRGTTASRQSEKAAN
jgi:hypothetical protein